MRKFQFSFNSKTQICTLFSMQTITALRVITEPSSCIIKRISSSFACKNLSYLPRVPDIGNISDHRWHSVIGLSPRHGSHAAAPIASFCGWTEVSLSPRAGHRAPTAASVLVTPICRSVIRHFTELSELNSFGKVPCLSDL